MAFVQPEQFTKRFTVYRYAQLQAPTLIDAKSLVFPRGIAIHYLPRDMHSVGIESSHPLMLNVGDKIFNHSVEELKIIDGNPRLKAINTMGFRREYHRKHRQYIWCPEIQIAMENERFPLVVNYSVLDKKYMYQRTIRVMYFEWLNKRATMWDKVAEIGSLKHQFIPVYLPTVIPARINELDKYKTEFENRALSIFTSPEAFDLRDIWRSVDPKITDHPVSKLDKSVVDKVNYVFIEGDKVVILNLGVLREWAIDEGERFERRLYSFLDYLVTMRNHMGFIGEVDEDDDKSTDDSDDDSDTNKGDEDGTPTMVVEKDIDAQEGNDEEFEWIEDTGKDIGNQKSINTTVEDNGTEAIRTAIREKGELGLLSTAQQKGLDKLLEKNEDLVDDVTGKKIKDLKLKDSDLWLADATVGKVGLQTTDKSMLGSNIAKSTEIYVSEVLHKDILRMIYAVQYGGIIVKKIRTEDYSDVTDIKRTYSVTVQPPGGEQSTFKFTIPLPRKDGTYLAGGIEYRMERQKSDVPYMKIKPDTVALSSYYGKVFIVRNGNAVSNYSRWIINKVMALLMDDTSDRVKSVRQKVINLKGVKVPRAYSGLAEKFSQVETKDALIMVDYHAIDSFFPKEFAAECKRSKRTPVGKYRGPNGENFIAIYKNGLVSEYLDGKWIPVGTIPYLIDPDMGEGPMEYAEVGVLDKRIPTILAMAYLKGLDQALKDSGVRYKVVPSTYRMSEDEQVNLYRIKFKDVSYLCDVTKTNQAFTVAGFNAIRKITQNYMSRDFEKRAGFVNLLTAKGITVRHWRELAMHETMFIDPITYDELKRRRMPTTYYGLLLQADRDLVHDTVPKYEEYRLRGYERFAGIVYHEIAMNMRIYNSQGNRTDKSFSINPKAVWLNILQDRSVGTVERLNPLQLMKEEEGVTYAGWGGRNSDTMTKDARGYKENDYGVFSEAGPDSGKVGIRSYLAPNANITDLRGNVREFDNDKDGVGSVLSSTALYAPFSVNDDAKRMNFVGTQSIHTVACPGYTNAPARTGFENVVGHRSDGYFTAVAEEDGRISDIKDDVLVVNYKTKGITNIPIGVKHGVVSGTVVPHDLTCDMRVGDKFKAGHILAYHKDFFTRNELDPTTVDLKFGRVCNVALASNADLSDDGLTISSRLLGDFATPLTERRDIVVDFKTNVFDLLKIGDLVTEDSILCTLEESLGDEFQSVDMKAVAALQEIAANTPRAKHEGRISNIEVVYFGDTSDMTESLRKAALESDSRRKKKNKLYGSQYAPTGRIRDVVRAGGVKVTKNMAAIRIYIDYMVTVGTADKFVVGNQLKGTVSRIMEGDMIAEDGTIVDAEFGCRSVQDRIVKGIIYEGLVNLNMMALCKKVATM